MKINTVEMHQFHKYAHGLHISISKRLNRTKFWNYSTDVFGHPQGLDLWKPVQASMY